jgi:hypothetical protein
VPAIRSPTCGDAGDRIVEPIAAPIGELAEIDRMFETLARAGDSGMVIPGDTVLEAPAVRASIVRLPPSTGCRSCMAGARSWSTAG